MKTVRVMPPVTVQNSQLGHNMHSANYFFLIYMMTQFAKSTEYSYLDSFTKDNSFITYL